MSAVHDFLLLCWDRCPHTRKGYLAASEIPDLITQLEAVLGTRAFLEPEESQLLRKIILDRPTLRLYKRELDSFILRLVHCKSPDELMRRCQVSPTRLKTLMELHLVKQKDSTVGYTSTIPTGSRSAGHTTSSAFRPRYSLYTDLRDDTKMLGYASRDPWLKSEYTSTDPWRYVRQEPQTLTPETPTQSQSRSWSDLFTKIWSSTSLRLLFPKRFWTGAGEPLNEVAQLQKKIAELQEQQRLATRIERNRPDLLALEKAVRDQEKQILMLERRLQSPARALFRRTVSGQDTREAIFRFFLAGFLYLFAMNVVKMVYYMGMSVATRSGHGNGYYSDFDGDIEFSWVQEYAWLEYAIYRVQEWSGW